jgi:hypothetical protein
MERRVKYPYVDVRHSHSGVSGHLLEKEVEFGLERLGSWSTIRPKLAGPASPIKISQLEVQASRPGCNSIQLPNYTRQIVLPSVNASHRKTSQVQLGNTWTYTLNETSYWSEFFLIFKLISSHEGRVVEHE